ncbi:hypothetical protein ACLOJK_018693 [Asimina triloba]
MFHCRSTSYGAPSSSPRAAGATHLRRSSFDRSDPSKGTAATSQLQIQQQPKKKSKSSKHLDHGKPFFFLATDRRPTRNCQLDGDEWAAAVGAIGRQTHRSAMVDGHPAARNTVRASSSIMKLGSNSLNDDKSQIQAIIPICAKIKNRQQASKKKIEPTH